MTEPAMLTRDEFEEQWWKHIGPSLNKELAENGQFDDWVCDDYDDYCNAEDKKLYLAERFHPLI